MNSLLDSVRKDREITLEEKNQKILTIQSTLDDLKKDKSCQMSEISQLKLKMERMEHNVAIIDAEKEHLISRLSSAEKAQLSQKQIESAMNEMMQAKNKLAYEKGVLESRVEQLNLDMKGLSGTQLDIQELKQKYQAFKNQNDNVCSELKLSRMQLEEKKGEVRELKGTCCNVECYVHICPSLIEREL